MSADDGMPEIQINITPPVSIAEVVARYPMPDEIRAALLASLRAREDELAEAMQLFARVYGMYPQIIAYCLLALQFGSPKSAEHRQMIFDQHQQLLADRPWERGE